MIKKFKKMKGKKAKAMVATWSDEESDSSTESEEEGPTNLCLMAHANEVEEVSSEENSFSLDELEIAYSHLLEKYSKLKHDNRDLKRKIETYVYNSTSCSKCNVLENEIENLNDKHASLNSEHDKIKSHASQFLEENQKLKCDMSVILKENSDMKETISRLIKGKQSLDQVLSIPINFQKEGLGYTLNQKCPQNQEPY